MQAISAVLDEVRADMNLPEQRVKTQQAFAAAVDCTETVFPGYQKHSELLEFIARTERNEGPIAATCPAQDSRTPPQPPQGHCPVPQGVRPRLVQPTAAQTRTLPTLETLQTQGCFIDE